MKIKYVLKRYMFYHHHWTVQVCLLPFQTMTKMNNMCYKVRGYLLKMYRDLT